MIYKTLHRKLQNEQYDHPLYTSSSTSNTCTAMNYKYDFNLQQEFLGILIL